MDEISECLSKSKKLSKDVKELTNSISANEEQIGELVREERYLKEQISKASEKLFKLQKQFEKKRTVGFFSAECNLKISKSFSKCVCVCVCVCHRRPIWH